MSQAPPSKRTSKQSAAASADQTAEREAKDQISDEQLEKVTGGSNVQGSRLEALSNQTIGQPESLNTTEEVST